jgi:aquaporin Z
MPEPLARRLLAEFLGTLLLVFAGCGAIVVNDLSGGVVSHVGIAVTFGLVVMAMIYAFGDISGAHFNPAVSLAFAISGRFTWKEVGHYVLTQCAGALLGALLLMSLLPGHATYGTTMPGSFEDVGITIWQAGGFEVVLTFALMLVILAVSIGAKEKGITAAIAIGGTVGLEAMFAGPVCGASMNPARSLGPAVVSGNLQGLWMYLLAPALGAALAVPAYLFSHHTQHNQRHGPGS